MKELKGLLMTRQIAIIVTLSMIAGAWIALSMPTANAHCQMPCGIYDDPARIAGLKEDAATIRKAVTSLRNMMEPHDHAHGEDHEHADDMTQFNQGTRWIMTKDQHAQAIQDVVSYYFLTQRVKAVPTGKEGHETYIAQLAGFHRILVAAMKCKQTADLAMVDELDAAIAAVAGWYTD
ncbi:MAG: superoxide dismutase [Ni] [Phycisphaerales bacterium]|nr:superoxide dismutase [Ni] [Phycisphaerales bacterium]